MAASQSILDALCNLEFSLCEASALADALTDLAGDQQGAPQWPFILSRQVERIDAAAEALGVLVRQQALPLLRDMEAVRAR